MVVHGRALLSLHHHPTQPRWVLPLSTFRTGSVSSNHPALPPSLTEPVAAQGTLGTFSSLQRGIDGVASLQAQLRAAVLAFPFATCFALLFNPLFPPPTRRWQQKFTGSDSPLLHMEEQTCGFKQAKKKKKSGRLPGRRWNISLKST